MCPKGSGEALEVGGTQVILFAILQLAYLGIGLLVLAIQEWNGPGCFSRNEDQ